MATKKETPSERARRLGPATSDHLKKKQSRSQRVYVPLDDELADEVARLAKDVESDRLYLAKVRGNGGTDDARQKSMDDKVKKLEKLREELRDNTIVMKLVSIGRKRYENLIAEHPLSEEDKAKLREDNPDGQLPDFDPDTFPAALVGASCVEPDLSEGSYVDEESNPPRTRYPLAEEIWDEWNQGELTALFQAAYQVNTQRRVVDLGEG